MTLAVMAIPYVNVGFAPLSNLLAHTALSQPYNFGQINATCATPTSEPDSHSLRLLPTTFTYLKLP